MCVFLLNTGLCVMVQMSSIVANQGAKSALLRDAICVRAVFNDAISIPQDAKTTLLQTKTAQPFSNTVLLWFNMAQN